MRGILRGDGDRKTTIMRKGLTKYLGFYRKDAICFVNFARDNFKLLIIKKHIEVLLNFVNSLIFQLITFFYWCYITNCCDFQ